MGRPITYKPEYAAQAKRLCLLGATDVELADFFSVSRPTLDKWKHQYDEFFTSLKVGKAEADERVERSLFQRASGYSHESEKVFCQQGLVTKVKTVEHYPPDTVACIFWLKNRRPDLWREKVDIAHSGNLTVNAVDYATMVEAKAVIEHIQDVSKETE